MTHLPHEKSFTKALKQEGKNVAKHMSKHKALMAKVDAPNGKDIKR